MRIRYDPRALSDLQNIYDYICQDNAVAASRVIERIRRSIERLKVLPFSGRPGRKTDIRILSVPEMPYIVIHRVHNDFVEIVAVFHTARDYRE